jgi:hypothetical protein
MRTADLVEFVKGLAVDVRTFVERAIDPIKQKQAELETRLEAHQAQRGEPGASAYELACAEGFTGSRVDWLKSLFGEPGQSVAAEDLRPMVDELVSAAAARLPAPADGQDGKSVTIEEVTPVVEQAVQRATDQASSRLEASVRATVGAAMAALPEPTPGKDGTSVTPEDVRPLLDELVRSAVGALPAAADGKDGRDGRDGMDGASVTLDEVRPLVEEAVAALPVPKSLTAEDLQPLVRELVAEAAAAVPPGADGKDGADGQGVTVDDVRPVLRELVETAVAALPPAAAGADGVDGVDGKDGQSVSLHDARALLQELVDDAVAQLPVPADGKSVSLDDVRPLVCELVDAAVAQIPVPADGKSVTLDEMQPLVQRAVGEVPRFGADDVHPLVAEQLSVFASALSAKFASADHAR